MKRGFFLPGCKEHEWGLFVKDYRIHPIEGDIGIGRADVRIKVLVFAEIIEYRASLIDKQ